MKSLVFVAAVLFDLMLCDFALGTEQLVADPERSYVLETEITVVVTIHGHQWVLQAQFPRGDVLEGDRPRREVTLRPKWAQLHFGPHVDIAFRVPAGPRVPPAFLDHISYEATELQVSFAPSADSRKREVLIRLTPFVANGKAYRVKGREGDEDPIPLMIRVPLP